MLHDNDGSDHDQKDSAGGVAHGKVRLATPVDVKGIVACSKRYGPTGDSPAVARNRISGKHSTVYVVEIDKEIAGWFQVSKDGMANRLLIYSCPEELVVLALIALKDTLLGHTDRHAKVVVKEENFELMGMLVECGYSEYGTSVAGTRMFIYRIGSGGTKGPTNRMKKYFEEYQ